jgi:hypothetical protein
MFLIDLGESFIYIGTYFSLPIILTDEITFNFSPNVFIGMLS